MSASLRASARWLLPMLVCAALVACQRDPASSADALAQEAQQVPVNPAPALEPHSPASASASALDGPAATTAQPRVEHVPERSEACRAHSESAAAPRSVTVHRWVDAAGITHYSDQAPGSAVANHRLIEVSGLPAVAVHAAGYDVNLPDQLQQRAVTDALGVQRVLRDALGVGAPAGLTLNIVFVRAADAYARLIGDPVLAASAGAYATAQRTIYVRMQPRDEASFAVLRHEITHALVHETIGNLPTPLNEGLAEYFGRYRAGGLGGQVDIGADREAIIAAAPAADGSEALVDLLARDGAEFYATAGGAADTREQRYLRAYALVALLMRDAPGRAVLAAVLAAQQADPCRPAATEAVLDARYRGGLRGLAAAWADFMRNPAADIQAY